MVKDRDTKETKGRDTKILRVRETEDLVKGYKLPVIIWVSYGKQGTAWGL